MDYRSHVKAYANILPDPPHSFSCLSPSHGVVGTMHSDFGRDSVLAAVVVRSAVAPQKQWAPPSTPATDPGTLRAPWHDSAHDSNEILPSTAASNRGNTGPVVPFFHLE